MIGEMDRFLAVGAALFVIGAIGFLTRRNLILIFLSAELMMHGVGLTFVTFGKLHFTLEGQVMTIMSLTVAACEAGLALALILALYQISESLDVELWTDLREPDLQSPVSVAEMGPPEPTKEPEFPRLTPAGPAPVLPRRPIVVRPGSNSQKT